MSSSFISLKNVNLKYDNSNYIFKDLSFSIKKGEFISIVGPSGCGKTTLLKSVVGLIQVADGHISIDGLTPLQAKEKRSFGFLFQSPFLLPWKTVLENILLPHKIIGSDGEEAKKKVIALLKIVGLSDVKNALPEMLSYGMQQRVAFVRAISYNPKILLLDEPFNSLDELMKEKLQLELLNLWELHKHTIILVTHNITEAVLLSQKIIILSNKPTKIKKVITVNLPKQRDLSLMNSKKFMLIKEEVKKNLENE